MRRRGIAAAAPDHSKISFMIDEVDVPNRIVHGFDRSGGNIQATFHDIDDTHSIPAPQEMWIAERTSWDSWRLMHRITQASDNSTLDTLSPGDRLLSAIGTLLLEGNQVLVDNSPTNPLEIVNRQWVIDYVLDAIDTVSSGGPWSVTSTKTGLYTVDFATDGVIPVDSTGGAFTIQLPATPSSGQHVLIKDVGGACTANNVTLDPLGSETIEGASTFLIKDDRSSFWIWSDGTNYYVS